MQLLANTDQVASKDCSFANTVIISESAAGPLQVLLVGTCCGVQTSFPTGGLANGDVTRAASVRRAITSIHSRGQRANNECRRVSGGLSCVSGCGTFVHLLSRQTGGGGLHQIIEPVLGIASVQFRASPRARARFWRSHDIVMCANLCEKGPAGACERICGSLRTRSSKPLMSRLTLLDLCLLHHSIFRTIRVLFLVALRS